MNELWSPICDFDGYEVSNLGRVRSWWRKGPNSHRSPNPKIMRGSVDGNSVKYFRVTLAKNGEKHTLRVHHLVLTAFVGERPEGKWALHNDGNSLNNKLSNLRWGTPKENCDDRTKHGNTMFGESNPKSKLSSEDVKEIREAYQSGEVSQVELAEVFGVTQPHISAIVLQKTWRHTE